MLKHIGRHGEKEVVVVFRELHEPNSHLALVVYTERLPSNYYDGLLKLVQSPSGQNENNLSELLANASFTDNAVMLETFHQKGWLKKVPSKQIIMTANAKSKVRLDEINEILNKLEQGGEGAQEMADLDAHRGNLHDPANDKKVVDVEQFKSTPVPNASGVLDDNALAQSNINQATQMEAQIKTLTEEADRLKAEAYEMAPKLKPKRAYKARAKKADSVAKEA